MPSQVMQELIEELRDRQKASTGQALPLGELRATFAPGAAFTRCLTTCW